MIKRMTPILLPSACANLSLQIADMSDPVAPKVGIDAACSRRKRVE